MHQVTEIEVDGQDLYAAVDLACAVVPARTPMESLKNLLIQASDGILTISAGDSETSLRASVSAEVTGKVDFAVLASTCKSILAGCSGSIRISVEERRVVVFSSNGRYVLPLAVTDGLVPAMSFNSVDYLTTDLPRFRAAIRMAVRCVSEVKDNGALVNVFVDPLNGRVSATDTRRILIAFVPWEKVGDPRVPDPVDAATNQVLLSTTCCSVLQRLSGSTIDAEFTDSVALFRVGAVVVNCKLSVGRFPNLKRFTEPASGSMSTNCEIPAGAVADAVSRVRIVVTAERSRAIFEFGQESLVVSSDMTHLGEAEASIPISLKGPSVTFAADPKYVHDYLSKLDKVSPVRFGMKDFESYVFMDCEQFGWRYVVMPIVLEEKPQ